MEEGTESSLWQTIRNFFTGKTENPIQDVIREAQENNELGTDLARILDNVLQLDLFQIKDIMIPRTDIDCVEEKASIKEVSEVIINSGHSRIPVYKDNKDQITGIVHAKDLLTCLPEPENKDISIDYLMRPPLFVPETKNVKSMLLDFQNKKVHLAIAIDEYGGTSGLITLEDVLEEIVGEIEDEYDTPKLTEITMLEDESCLVSGRTTLEDLYNQLNIELKSDYVETLGGFITEKAGRLPEEGESFKLNNHSFYIKEADNKQLIWILVYPQKDQSQETNDQ